MKRFLVASLAVLILTRARWPRPAVSPAGKLRSGRSFRRLEPAERGDRECFLSPHVRLRAQPGFQSGRDQGFSHQGLAEVTAVVSTPKGQQMTKLFVSKDYAIAGELMPFGADPFTRERAILQKGAFGPTKGADKPAITIVEFGDLECPACKQVQPAIEKLMSEEPKVRLIFQNYPLDQIHPWAQKAAAYVDCIMRENNDAAWKFIASVYEQQDAMNQLHETGADALTASSTSWLRPQGRRQKGCCLHGFR